MSLARIQARIPGAIRMGLFMLDGHDLRFHKRGDDGSGKCDAYRTDDGNDKILGALFDITWQEKQQLDVIEGLGLGYDEKTVRVRSDKGLTFEAVTYFAISIDPGLKPYSWYLNHVVVGASELQVPTSYTDRIKAIASIEDPDSTRDAAQRAVHALK